jgi:simple sugar transport system permease protein
MKRIKTILKSTFNVMKPSLLAVFIGFLAGLIILFIFNPSEAFPAFFTIFFGAFNDGTRSLGNWLYAASPIILTGLSVAFAFRTGLFNIGASGQMMVGSFVAVYIGVKGNIPGNLHWIVALLAGTLAGGIWGLIPGLLKAFRNVNEVVTSIMLNYVAGYVIYTLIDAHIRSGQYARSRYVKSSAMLPSLQELLPRSTANIGIFIAIAIAIIIHLILHRTTFGFELKASGYSMDGSKYAGMNTKKNVVLAMFISGLLAGMAGGVAYLVNGKAINTAFAIFPEGFDGISVALLGLGEPLGALFAGLFLSNVRTGAFYMQGYSFTPEIIDMIIAIIIYTTAISAGLQIFLKRYRSKIKTLWNKMFKKHTTSEEKHTSKEVN